MVSIVIVLPFVGVLVYLGAQGEGMARAQRRSGRSSQAQIDAYVRPTAGTGGADGRDREAKQLLDSGAISQAEFDALKAKALA